MLTQLFQPEPNLLKGLRFAQALQGAGHEVEVLTGFPNYPHGALYPGYRRRLWQREMMEGIPVVRVPHLIDHSRSGLRRALSYLSVALSMSVVGSGLVRRPDVVHVYQGPATLGLPALWLRFVRRCQYVLDVQDLWPESVTDSGMLRWRWAEPLLHAWCGLTYRQAARIVVLSEGYKRVMVERGVPSVKIQVVYNWCSATQENLHPIRAKQDPFALAGKFNVVYAGNVGPLQGLGVIVDAADELRLHVPQAQFVVVGDGLELAGLQHRVQQAALTNVRFIPRQPEDRLEDIFGHAGALLVHLRDVPLCRVGIPSKTQASLAAGLPIIMAARGDAARLVGEADAGPVIEPEDPAALAAAVAKLLALGAEGRARLGANARRFYEAQMSFRIGFERMLAVFESARRAAASTGEGQ